MRQIDADALKEVFIQTLENIKSNPRMTGQEMHIITAIHTVGQMIDDAPTIDAEPVRHGKWNIEISDDKFTATYRCSECGHKFKWMYDSVFPPVFNYCQKCGARMRDKE